MSRRMLSALFTALVAAIAWGFCADKAQAQQTLEPNVFFHYPYTYFPHDYWPVMGPKYPEPIGTPYMRPPAYMALPAFKEPHWRYEYWQPQNYYRGFHFWLDSF